MPDYFILFMFPSILFLVFSGFPVAFSLMGTALVFGYLSFGPAIVHEFVGKVQTVATS